MIDGVEAGFIVRRRAPPDLPGAFAIAFAWLAASHPALARAGQRTAAAMDAAATGGATPPEPAYHNRHHAAEATLAMGLLCRHGVTQGCIDARHAAIGIAAMVGHDMGHDGSQTRGGVLERRSRDAAAALAAAAGVLPADLALLGDVILGTDPDQVAGNAARHAGRLPPGPLGPAQDALRVLANEADVCASLLPTLGPRLGLLLAQEWGADTPAGRLARTATGRLAFLRAYPCPAFPAMSGPARTLGLDAARLRGITAYAAAGHPFGAATTPEAGAAALDRMPPDAAAAAYAAALVRG